ncbi:PQQ-binding-like beta-propeller repeat protein [Streptomyces sp. NPDC059916]|uniref:PQQ-binding-like beta-propeller repeat protein n=1 Tax=Streptomyces sp. NPDC059916 TaxID=3347001 RepID=UPI00369DAD56
MAAPGRPWGDLKGETPEANALARWLRGIAQVRGETLRSLERLGPRRTQWSEYCSGAKIIPRELLAHMVAELVPPAFHERALAEAGRLRDQATRAARPAAPQPTRRGQDGLVHLQGQLNDALRQQLRAEQAVHRSQSIVQALMTMNAWLTAKCATVEAELDRARAATRPGALEAARRDLAQARAELHKTEQALTRAQGERLRAEQLGLAALQTVQRLNRALEAASASHDPFPPSESEGVALPAVPEPPEPTLEQYAQVLEQVVDALDDQDETLCQLQEDLGAESAFSPPDEPPVEEIVRAPAADTADNPVTSPDADAPGHSGISRRRVLLAGAASIATVGGGAAAWLTENYRSSPTGHAGGGHSPSPSHSPSASPSPLGVPRDAWTVKVPRLDSIEPHVTASASGVVTSPRTGAGRPTNELWAFNTAGHQLWKTTLDSGISSYAATNKTVFCTTETKLYALGWNGHHVWSSDPIKDLTSTAPGALPTMNLALGGGTNAVYAYANHGGSAFRAGTLYAFAADGRLRWSRTSGAFNGQPVEAGGVVYLGSHDKNLYAFDVSDGQPRWSVRLGSGMVGTPAVIGDVIAVAAAGRTDLIGVSTSGQRIWTSSGGSGGAQMPTVAAGGLFIAPYKDGYLATRPNGQPAWAFPSNHHRDSVSGDGLGDLAEGPAVVGNTLYCSIDSTLYAIDATNGNELWAHQKSSILETPVISENMIYLGSDSELIALRA